MRQLVATFALLATVSLGAGCEEPTSADRYVDGQVEMTDDAAFAATLFHAEGQPSVGDNTFYLRVAMPEQDGSEGRGIPGVAVSMDASTLDGSFSSAGQPVVSYEGDGTYRLDNVVLDASGPWSLDFTLNLGNIDERVAFSFIVEG